MRMRLGLLRDTAEIEKQIAREAAQERAKKHKHNIPTVKTEAQTKADEAAAARAKEEAEAPPKPAPKPRIRPLSEAKAIETGASFISEAFLFAVAGGLIFFESWRSRRKESSHREDVSDRLAELEESEKAARKGLVELERELLRLRAKEEKIAANKRILSREIWEPEVVDEKEEPEAQGWFRRIVSYVQGETKNAEAEDAKKPSEVPKNPVPAITTSGEAGRSPAPRKEETGLTAVGETSS